MAAWCKMWQNARAQQEAHSTSQRPTKGSITHRHTERERRREERETDIERERVRDRRREERERDIDRERDVRHG